MAIKKPIPITFNLDSHQSVQSVCAVIHIDDNNTETFDLSLMQGGEHVAVSPNSTVTARFVRVKNNTLISDDIACTVQENGNIYIPIDNAAAHMLVGEIKIEVNIVDENDILTMQFPLVIRVNNTILADAEICPISKGTIPELIEKAQETADNAQQAADNAQSTASTAQQTAGSAQTAANSAQQTADNAMAELGNKQDKLTAGDNITIEGNVISAEGGVTDYSELENKPILQIQSTNGTTQDITIENDIKLFPFYKDVFTGFIHIDDDNYYKTNLHEVKSIISFDDYLYPNADTNGVHLCNVNPEGIPHFINAKDDIFIVYHFTSEHNCASQIILWVDETTVKPKMAYRVCDYNHDTQQYNIKDFIEIGSGGSQIVSGVVNANGTITFTDSEGNSFTTSGESVIGADGFSPIATVQQTASGATITVTDKNGTTTANITNGQDGNDYVLTAQDKSDIADIVLAEFTGSIVNGELNTR